jgi:alkylhydroperoxidase/carboxymuconolactone decarboxylase family protein YurZ
MTGPGMRQGRRPYGPGKPIGAGSEPVDEYLPEIYEEFRRDYPTLARDQDAVGASLDEAGPLDGRSRRLVKLGVAVGAQSMGAVRSHVRRALDEGFTPAEIEHAVVLSLTTVGFPAMIAALKWTREVLQARR